MTGAPPRLVLATRSAGKLRELLPVFAAERLAVTTPDELGLPETVWESHVESHPTFEANALAKARWFFQVTGVPAVADDSGLEVDSLGGRPGVHSKRWSGRPDLHGQALDDENNALLQRELAACEDRKARYVCAAAYADGEREIVVRGETAGQITGEPRGGGGFGYDPYFLSSELGRTFGEVGRSEKEQVSHRGRAFRALIRQLRATPWLG